jgi:hypothetical protein
MGSDRPAAQLATGLVAPLAETSATTRDIEKILKIKDNMLSSVTTDLLLEV